MPRRTQHFNPLLQAEMLNSSMCPEAAMGKAALVALVVV